VIIDIPMDRALFKSYTAGEPLVTTHPDSPAARSIMKLTELLIQQLMRWIPRLPGEKKNDSEKETGVVTIDFKPTSPFCPIALKLALDIKSTASKIEGVKRVLVYCRRHAMEETINKIVN
jgi:hypothetical protein